MSSPAKRQKKNDYKSSPSTVRSLDHFFGKQKTNGSQDVADHTLIPKTSSLDTKSDDDPTALSVRTDEEIARKLQEQWNRDQSPQSCLRSPVAHHDHDRSLSTKTQLPELGKSMENQRPKHKNLENFTGEDEGQKNVPDAVQRPQLDGQQRSDAVSYGSGLGLGVRPAQESATTGDLVAQLDSSTQKAASLSLQSTGSEEDAVTSTIPLNENPLTFQPSKYIPALQRHWSAHGGGASYALLTRCFILVNSTQSRIKIVDTLVNFLRLVIEADPESLLPAVWLATNSIAPPFISMELGIGGSAISKALKQVCGLDSQGLKNLYSKHGDPGDVAFEAKKRQSYTLRKPRPLTVKGVYQCLVKVANSKGNGSQEVKQRIVERLLQDARGPEESRYIMRTLAQHLRIGAVKTTMLIALSRAFTLSRPPGADFPVRLGSELAALKKEVLTELYARGKEIVKACFARRPDYNDLIPALLEVGICEELRLRCGLALHVPLRPMLGSITRDLSEMLTKLQGRDFTCEYKYDGQRAQIHCDDRGKVSIFSRHLELMTDKYPDLVALVPKIRGEGVASFIMEGEVVAIDRESGDLKTFQTLAGRGRKDVVLSTLTVDVCLYAFDLMFLNGEELLGRPFRERRELLRSMFVEIPRHFTWVESIDATSTDSETVLEFFKSATEMKCEGIMVKVLDNLPNVPLQDLAEGGEGTPSEDPQELNPQLPESKKEATATILEKSKSKEKNNSRRKALLATYEPDKRLDSWLKVKKDYDNASFDTLDLIPVAGWHGQGRKAKWWSPILLAARNPESGSLEAVCKCISGFTDKFYSENKAKYALGGANVHARRPAYIEYRAGWPNVWFEPQEVWEMAFADITISPTYTAAIGLVSENKGLSLRFPRFLRKREDKSIDEASTTDFLAGLWRKQEAKTPSGVVTTKEVEAEGEEEEGQELAVEDEEEAQDM